MKTANIINLIVIVMTDEKTKERRKEDACSASTRDVARLDMQSILSKNSKIPRWC